MSYFQSSLRQPSEPHAHAADDLCPWCEQPITRAKFDDIKRRMTADFEREKAAAEKRAKAALEQVRAEAAAVAEERVAAVRNEAKLQAEAALTARLADIQARLADAEQAKTAAEANMAALKQAQEADVARRLTEAREALEKEKAVAVLAEQAKAFEASQKLQEKVLALQRQIESKKASELGEGPEIDLFEQLRDAFEGDRIRRVAKGVNGADVIHEVVHNGKVCGKIIYDAKNRNAWANEFASKLRADKLAEGADHAILSSNKFPKDRKEVHFQDGVIVASPARVLALAEILRGQVVRMHELKMSGVARDQKSEELYAFITSESFKQLLDIIEAQAAKLQELDAKEQEAHRRVWDNRAKLIRTVHKARCDLAFEVDRIIGTAGNGEPFEEPA